MKIIYLLIFSVLFIPNIYAQRIDSVKTLYELHKEIDKKTQDLDKSNVKNEASIQSLKDIQNIFLTSVGIIIAFLLAFSVFNQIDIQSKKRAFEVERKEILKEASEGLRQQAEEELQKITQLHTQALMILESIALARQESTPLNTPPEDHDSSNNQ